MKFLSSVFGEKNPEEENEPELTDEDYMRMSKTYLDTSWELIHSTEGWKLEKKATNGDIVHSKTVPGLGKVFKLMGEINFSPKKFIDDIFFNVESVPNWNPTILSVKRIKTIGDTTDMIYHVSAPIAGGLISSRDFMCVRNFTTRDGCFIIGGGSVQHRDAPINSKYIRGESGPGCHMVKPIPGIDDRCIFYWIVNIRMNGWIPQYLVDKGLTDAMFDYTKHIRSYGDKLQEQDLTDS